MSWFSRNHARSSCGLAKNQRCHRRVPGLVDRRALASSCRHCGAQQERGSCSCGTHRCVCRGRSDRSLVLGKPPRAAGSRPAHHARTEPSTPLRSPDARMESPAQPPGSTIAWFAGIVLGPQLTIVLRGKGCLEHCPNSSEPRERMVSVAGIERIHRPSRGLRSTPAIESLVC